MPKLYFFSLVCFELYKEHTVVQSTKWIGKGCPSDARIVPTCSDCNCDLNGLCNTVHGNCRNFCLFKLKSPAGTGLEQTLNKA